MQVVAGAAPDRLPAGVVDRIPWRAPRADDDGWSDLAARLRAAHDRLRFELGSEASG